MEKKKEELQKYRKKQTNYKLWTRKIGGCDKTRADRIISETNKSNYKSSGGTENHGKSSLKDEIEKFEDEWVEANWRFKLVQEC